MKDSHVCAQDCLWHDTMYFWALRGTDGGCYVVKVEKEIGSEETLALAILRLGKAWTWTLQLDYLTLGWVKAPEMVLASSCSCPYLAWKWVSTRDRQTLKKKSPSQSSAVLPSFLLVSPFCCTSSATGLKCLRSDRSLGILYHKSENSPSSLFSTSLCWLPKVNTDPFWQHDFHASS